LTPLDSKDYIVKVEEPEIEEVEDDGEWFEPDDEKVEEEVPSGGLIGRREETTSTGFLVGKKEEKPVVIDTGKTIGGGNTTGKTLGGETIIDDSTENVVCDICKKSFPKARITMHKVRCK
jgi:hypothetical protein